MKTEFYVTTREIEHPEREHTFRFPQGEPLPEGQTFKSQKPAGTVKLSEIARITPAR